MGHKLWLSDSDTGLRVWSAEQAPAGTSGMVVEAESVRPLAHGQQIGPSGGPPWGQHVAVHNPGGVLS